MSKQISEEQEKALKAVLAQLDKQFGKGTVMRLGDQTTEHDIQAISTGSLGLDIALGIGGLPRGRIVEIYFRQDDAHLARHRRSAKSRRHGRLY